MVDLELYLEAERRGILPPEKAALLDEARRRGLIDGATPKPVASAQERPSEIPVGRRSRRGPIEDMTPEQVRQSVGDLAAGAIRGAGSIGSTIIRPFESGESNQQRREAIDTVLRMAGANPESLEYATGKLGAEIAGTSGVGRVLSLGAKAIPALAPFATAIETGGFRTGMNPGVQNWLARAAGGAITGGVSNALIDPSTAGEGAAVGAAIPAVLAPVARFASKAVGKGIDLATGRAAQVKAGEIARDVAGPELARIQAANSAAPSGLTAGQAAAGIDRDVWQAFAELAAGKDTNSVYRKLADDQKRAQLDMLTRLAGGATQTEAKAARGSAKGTLNALATPMREQVASDANMAGALKPKLEAEAARMAEAAANKVEDVRRLTKAGDIATDAAKTWQPTVTQGGDSLLARTAKDHPGFQMTYPGKLALKADEMAAQAAEGSLRFGEASRFAQAAANSLEAYGLRPLESKSLGTRIKGLMRPEFAGNDVLEGSINNVAKDIEKWTNNKGVIDFHALEAIRKNSVAAAIQQLRPNMDQTAQKNLSAKVLGKIKPMIDDAIEQAGGTGWRDYLKTYEMGAHSIDQKKLAADALKMFQDSPEQFIKLVQGNNPKAVEKVFGPGSFDIVKEMGSKIKPMEKVADELIRDITIKEQAAAGREGLERILKHDLIRFRFPTLLDAKATIANKSLDILSERLGRKTMDAIVEGMQSGQSANEILNTFPTAERARILRVIGNVESWNPTLAKAAQTAAVQNKLAPENRNQLGR